MKTEEVELLTSEDVARKLGVKTRTVTRWVLRGRFSEPAGSAVERDDAGRIIRITAPNNRVVMVRTPGGRYRFGRRYLDELFDAQTDERS